MVRLLEPGFSYQQPNSSNLLNAGPQRGQHTQENHQLRVSEQLFSKCSKLQQNGVFCWLVGGVAKKRFLPPLLTQHTRATCQLWVRLCTKCHLLQTKCFHTSPSLSALSLPPFLQTCQGHLWRCGESKHFRDCCDRCGLRLQPQRPLVRKTSKYQLTIW